MAKFEVTESEAPTISEPPPASEAVDSLAGDRPGGGARRAAIFVLSLEENVASRLLRCLDDVELGRIAAEIAELGVIEKEAVNAVLREYCELERVQSVVQQSGTEAARRWVESSFDADKARVILSFLDADRANVPFAFLENLRAETVYACLAEEHPQTQAVVLAHMAGAQAQEFLLRVDGDHRQSLLHRVSTLRAADTEAVRTVELVLRKQLGSRSRDRVEETDGPRVVADILRASGNRRELFEELRRDSPDVAAEVHRHLFLFDDLESLDEDLLSSALERVHPRRVAVALQGADDAVRSRVRESLSPGSYDAVLQEFDRASDAEREEVEAARAEVVGVVLQQRTMVDSGTDRKGARPL